MKWSEIKDAVERSGISEDDEILEIHGELRDGDKKLASVKTRRLRPVERASVGGSGEKRDRRERLITRDAESHLHAQSRCWKTSLTCAG